MCNLKQAIDMSGQAAGGPGSRPIPRMLFTLTGPALAGPALFALVTYAFGWADAEVASVWSTAGGFALSLMFALLFVVMGETFIEDLVKLAFVLPIVWIVPAYLGPESVEPYYRWVHLPVIGLVCGGVGGFLLNTLGLGNLRKRAVATERPAQNKRQPSRAERREEDDRRRRGRREAEARTDRARREEREEKAGQE